MVIRKEDFSLILMILKHKWLIIIIIIGHHLKQNNFFKIRPNNLNLFETLKGLVY